MTWKLGLQAEHTILTGGTHPELHEEKLHAEHTILTGGTQSGLHEEKMHAAKPRSAQAALIRPWLALLKSLTFSQDGSDTE